MYLDSFVSLSRGIVRIVDRNLTIRGSMTTKIRKGGQVFCFIFFFQSFQTVSPKTANNNLFLIYLYRIHGCRKGFGQKGVEPRTNERTYWQPTNSEKNNPPPHTVLTQLPHLSRLEPYSHPDLIPPGAELSKLTPWGYI